MGGILSSFFQTGSSLLSSGNNRTPSEQTKKSIKIIFDCLQSNPIVTVERLDRNLNNIPKNENILLVHNEEGYNLLQKCVGINNKEMVKWILGRKPDVNRGACSLPLHIACYRGFVEITEMLIKYGARSDVEARMCWPGPHSPSCEQRGRYCIQDESVKDRSSEKLQSAIYFAMEGDHVNVLDVLIQQGEENWFPWQQKRPLLHIACEKGASNCLKHLLSTRSHQINKCYDEYYPIHQAVLYDIRFMTLLMEHGAETTVRTATQQMTVLHVVFLLGKKSADDTYQTVKLLLDRGLRDLINEPDSLGNTPLHALIVRYALEEARYAYDHDPQPWNKWDMLNIVRFLLQSGASPSINQPGNSALASVLRHVRDWEFRYELLDMLLQHGGDPNVVGRDGSVPLMVCLVPLINKDPLHHLSHTLKVCYLNCVRILCKNGANPNCCSRSNLTPLHVLGFTASENIMLNREEEKAESFEFIRQLLVVLLQYGLDPNVRFSSRTPHILVALMDMVGNARTPTDLKYVYDLTITLLTHGANPNTNFSTTEPMICHSQSSVFLRKNVNQVLYYFVQLISRTERLLHDAYDMYSRIIMLYYLCMDHKELYSCLKLLYTQTGLIPTQPELTCLIRELYSRPRTLKQLARVEIYKAMGRKTSQNVNKLPLPGRLKDYILNWTP